MASTPAFNEFTRQASFFLRDKIKTARLVISDVTPEELFAEEVTTEQNHLPPDKRTMDAISKAAFEVDQFERIARILHRRFLRFDRKSWRASYNALVLLEHLLIQGPLSTRKEFQSDRETIEEMNSFQYVDEKGFNWGMRVRTLCERVLRLLEEESYLREERVRVRKQQTLGRIVGSGNFSARQPPAKEALTSPKDLKRHNSLFNHSRDQKSYNSIGDVKYSLLISQEDKGSTATEDGDCHPFCRDKKEAKVSLLSLKQRVNIAM